jgi:membrane associated rhomboid family serine protease
MLLQFWGAFQQIAGFGGVSALAHLGGTAAGVLLWVVWSRIESQPASAPAIEGS